MSPFAIFPWFLLFLIVTTTQPRRYGPLDGFWIPKCVTTGAQKTSVGSIGSKMEVKFQEIAMKFHILMHRYIYFLFEFDVSFLSGMAPFAPPPAVKHLVSSSERSIRFGVPLPLSAWGAPYRQASLSHWGRAWNQQVLDVKICEMEINGTKLRICSVWTRNPLQRLWVVFWFGGEHSVSKGNKKTLLLRSKCFSGHEKMFTCMNMAKVYKSIWMEKYNHHVIVVKASTYTVGEKPCAVGHPALGLWVLRWCPSSQHTTSFIFYEVTSWISAVLIFWLWNPSFNKNKWRYQARCTPSWVKHQHPVIPLSNSPETGLGQQRLWMLGGFAVVTPSWSLVQTQTGQVGQRQKHIMTSTDLVLCNCWKRDAEEHLLLSSLCSDPGHASGFFSKFLLQTAQIVAIQQHVGKQDMHVVERDSNKK